MKFSLKALFFPFLMGVTSVTNAEPVYLYDPSGNVAAVVNPYNDLDTVYSASGDPVGYVDASGSVYSYSGTHMGWYNNGVFYDNNGYILAFGESNVPNTITAPSLVKKEVVLTTPATPPTIVTPTQVVTTPPTYVYQVSPTPINQVLTVQPAQ